MVFMLFMPMFMMVLMAASTRFVLMMMVLMLFMHVLMMMVVAASARFVACRSFHFFHISNPPE